MRNIKIIFTFLVAGALFTSCDKDLASELLNLKLNPGVRSEEFTIYPNPTSGDTTLADIPLNYNVDSLIRANSSQSFSSFTITSAKLKSLKMVILSPSTANFDIIDDASAVVEGGSLPTATIASVSNIPTGSTEANFTVDNSVNMKDYVNPGSNASLTLSGSTNSPVTDTIEVRVDYDVEIEVEL